MIGRKALTRWGGIIFTLLCMSLLAGCAKEEKAIVQDPGKDVERIEERGVLKVGITDYYPIDYQEGETWTGFDAQLCQDFAKWLCGAQAEFMVIDWNQKTELLSSGEIDCIWNAMTKTQELEEKIDCFDPYMYSAEVFVLPAPQFDFYTSAEQCSHLLFAVEDGSTAQKKAIENKLRTIPYKGQNPVFDAVVNKECDAAIVDKIFATLMTGEGAPYELLGYGFPLNTEEISVGLRKGSSLTEKINEYLRKSKEDGSLAALAEKYGLLDVIEP